MQVRAKRINVPVNEMELAALKCAAWRGQQSLADFMRSCAEQQVTAQDRALAVDKLAKGNRK